MTPIPITKPDGTVHAYACGRCGFISAGWSHGGEWNADDLERTRERAEECCRCRTCKAEIPRDRSVWGSDCEACESAAQAERAATQTARVIADCNGWENAVAHHARAWRFLLDNGRYGTLYVGDDYAGVFSSGWARLLPCAEEPDTYIASETLQRSEERAALGALENLVAYYDVHVTWLRPLDAEGTP